MSCNTRSFRTCYTVELENEDTYIIGNDPLGFKENKETSGTVSTSFHHDIIIVNDDHSLTLNSLQTYFGQSDCTTLLSISLPKLNTPHPVVSEA